MVYAGVENHSTMANDWRWRKRGKMQGLPRIKESKTHNYMCQMEEPGA